MRLITDKFASGHYEYFSEIPERGENKIKNATLRKEKINKKDFGLN